MSNNQIAQDAFLYLNEIRQKPRNAIAPLKDKLKYFKGNTLYLPGEIGLMTQEGPAAY